MKTITKKQIKEAIETRNAEHACNCLHVTNDEIYNKIREAMSFIDQDEDTKEQYALRLYDYLN